MEAFITCIKAEKRVTKKQRAIREKMKELPKLPEDK